MNMLKKVIEYIFKGFKTNRKRYNAAILFVIEAYGKERKNR